MATMMSTLRSDVRREYDVSDHGLMEAMHMVDTSLTIQFIGNATTEAVQTTKWDHLAEHEAVFYRHRLYSSIDLKRRLITLVQHNKLNYPVR